jgi:hypothetical protein
MEKAETRTKKSLKKTQTLCVEQISTNANCGRLLRMIFGT